MLTRMTARRIIAGGLQPNRARLLRIAKRALKYIAIAAPRLAPVALRRPVTEFARSPLRINHAYQPPAGSARQGLQLMNCVKVTLMRHAFLILLALGSTRAV